jgi:hypothetical protein
MEHRVSPTDFIANCRIEQRIADPEGMDRQTRVPNWKIAQQAVREIVDDGNTAIARKQQIDEPRPYEASATCNQNMCVRAELNHVPAMVVQRATLLIDPWPRNTRESFLYSQGRNEQPVFSASGANFIVHDMQRQAAHPTGRREPGCLDL